MVEHAKARGIQLCVENLSERALDFEQAFGEIEALGMTLDIGHGELLSKKTPHMIFLRNTRKRFIICMFTTIGATAISLMTFTCCQVRESLISGPS